MKSAEWPSAMSILIADYSGAEQFRTKQGVLNLFNRIVSKRTRLMMVVASMSLLLGGTAFAGSVSTSLGVSGSVTDDCTIAAAPSATAVNYTVYGQVPGGQNIPAATDYANSVSVTVNF